MPGSSELTDDQQDWYRARFGERYVTVQEQPYRPSRRVRRGKASEADVAVLDAQRRAVEILRGARIRPI